MNVVESIHTFLTAFFVPSQVVPGDVVARGARAAGGARVRDDRVEEPRDRADAGRPARPAYPEALALPAGRHRRRRQRRHRKVPGGVLLGGVPQGEPGQGRRRRPAPEDDA